MAPLAPAASPLTKLCAHFLRPVHWCGQQLILSSTPAAPTPRARGLGGSASSSSPSTSTRSSTRTRRRRAASRRARARSLSSSLRRPSAAAPTSPCTPSSTARGASSLSPSSPRCAGTAAQPAPKRHTHFGHPRRYLSLTRSLHPQDRRRLVHEDKGQPRVHVRGSAHLEHGHPPFPVRPDRSHGRRRRGVRRRGGRQEPRHDPARHPPHAHPRQGAELGAIQQLQAACASTHLLIPPPREVLADSWSRRLCRSSTRSRRRRPCRTRRRASSSLSCYISSS